MRTRDLPRLLRTVSHLRGSQVWHRVRLTLRRKAWSRRVAAIDARYATRAARAGAWRWDDAGLAAFARLRADGRDPARAIAVARDALAGRFTLLGETRELGTPVPWDRPDLMQALLWKTHLHEMAWAVDLAIAHRASGDAAFRDGFFALARGWHDAQPIGKPGFARVAWNERVVATRLLHWAAAGALFELRGGDADADWLGAELVRHAVFLRDNLALDLLANHLFRDCVALVFANALSGAVPDADALLQAEVHEQILADGAHVERCPMYHAVCVGDLVDLVALRGDASPAWLRDALARSAGFLEAILLGDGDVPLLGDGWRGEVDVARLLAQARSLGPLRAPEAPHAVSGVAPIARGALRCVARVGAHGPPYQLGHAHADLLSFDLSHGATRIVTDTGTAAYAAGAVRTHLRSTAAHNTVQLGGAELLEAWSSFRSGRRGEAIAQGAGTADRFRWLAARHDAYAWLAGQPTPHRLWLLAADELWVIDAVVGRGRQRIASRLHLHPDAPPGAFHVAALAGKLGRERAPLHEHFGETREMTRLVVETEAALPWVGGWWIRFGSTRPSVASLVLDGGVVRLRDETIGLALAWRLDASGDAAVAVAETR